MMSTATPTVRKRPRRHKISDRKQAEALVSPVRQEILDSVRAIGPCPVAQMALELGRPADSIYYHVRKLVSVGLLELVGLRHIDRHDEAIYDVVADRIELEHDLNDPKYVELASRLVASLFRVAGRNVIAALAHERARVKGPARNVHAGRSVAWLSKDDIRKVNAHLIAIIGIFERSRSDGRSKELCSVAWGLALLDARPRRRESAD